MFKTLLLFFRIRSENYKYYYGKDLLHLNNTRIFMNKELGRRRVEIRKMPKLLKTSNTEEIKHCPLSFSCTIS